MKTQRSGLILLARMVILALIASGCQSSQSPKGPPDGEYRRSGILLIIDQGRFSVSVSDPNVDKVEEGSYTLDGDKITFTTENYTALTRYCKNNPT